MSDEAGGVPVRLWEGEHFRLTPEQSQALALTFDRVRACNDVGAPVLVLGQVWRCVDGDYFAALLVPEERATMLAAVIQAPVVVAVEERAADVEGDSEGTLSN